MELVSDLFAVLLSIILMLLDLPALRQHAIYSAIRTLLDRYL